MTPEELADFYEHCVETCPFWDGHNAQNCCQFCLLVYGLRFWADWDSDYTTGDVRSALRQFRQAIIYYEQQTGRTLKGYAGRRERG